ncbi:MAG: HAD-IIB family hydrolase [Candidatus Harrisonbacteria bacterium]|nr:HAD-IIB family hydrolase [Candidatus Harrisonbacteria bacterium]
MKKLIIFDLDGTLTSSKSPMDSEMAGLLGKLLRTKMVAIISGSFLPQFQRQFLGNLRAEPEALKNLYLFPTCGAAFYQYHAGTATWDEVYTERLTPQEKVRIAQAFINTFREQHYKHPETIYGDVLEDRGTQIAFSAFGQEAPLVLKQGWDPDAQKRLKIVSGLQKYIPDFNAHIGGTTSIDVTRKGIDKAYGIKKMEEHLGVTKSEMLFVGDKIFPGGNDYPAKAVGVECMPVENPDDTKGLIRTLLVG